MVCHSQGAVLNKGVSLSHQGTAMACDRRPQTEVLLTVPFLGLVFSFSGLPSSSPSPSALALPPLLSASSISSLAPFTPGCEELNELPFPRAAAMEKGGLCLTQRNESLMVNFQAN